MAEEKECPLCMEPMEPDDLAFYPCDCRYQVCRFCWAKIINEENGLCPACRKEYNSEKPAVYKPVSESEDTRLRSNRKRKEHLKKTKLTSEMLKILPELRVVQPNLIFVVGLPAWICKDKEILKGPDYFGRYGKVFKVEINQNQTFGGPQGQPSFSAYITYCRSEDAMRSIRELDQGLLHGRPLRVSLGTTKYCSQFLRGTKCTKHECMYLHELGDPAASFTKEEMQAGKHTEYMNRLLSDCAPPTPIISLASAGNPIAVECTASSFSNITEGSSSLPSKELPNVQMVRSRGKPDVMHDNSLSLSSPSKHSVRSKPSRQFNGPDSNPGAPIGDDKRSRQFRSQFSCPDPSKISEGTYSDEPPKENVWNRHIPPPDYLHTDAHNVVVDKAVLRSYCPIFTNGLDTPEFNDSSDQTQRKLTATSRVPSHIDSDRTLGSRKINDVVPNGFTNCGNSFGTWYPLAASSESGTQSNFGDESVDIDFDPFRESQQGLAELLAAEVGKLNVSEDLSHRVLNGHLESNERVSAIESSPRSQLMEPSGFERNLSDYGSRAVGSGNFPWLPTFMPSERENSLEFVQENSSSVFPSRLFPPPGFEDNIRVLNQSTDAPGFAEVSSNNAMEFGSCSSPCSTRGPLTVGYNNSSLSNTNGPVADSASQFPYSHAPHSFPTKFASNCLPFENNLHSKSKILDPLNQCNSPLGNYRPYSGSSEGNGSFKGDQASSRQDSQQAIANLFTAAFNTASAMLNNRNSIPGDKSSPTVSKSSPSTFDLNAFFNHLCRQSPLFSSLNNPNMPEWNSGVNGNSRSTTSLHDNLIDSSPTALAAAASALFPMQFPSKSAGFMTTDDSTTHGRTPFQNETLVPGLQKPLSFHHHSQGLSENASEMNTYVGSTSIGLNSSSEVPCTTSPLTWQLDDPAIVSSQLTPSVSASMNQNNPSWKASSNSSPQTEFLQHLWRSGSTLPPLFDSQLVGPFSSSSSANIGNGNQRPQLRETSIHSASHVQSTE